ncbi:MAG: histidine phosphatase family protein [Pseudomonadota bacterium]
MTGPLIYYVRHGQTDWNAELRFQGQRDIPLNDRGREQARGYGEKLFALLGKAEDYVFISSPLSRARETMNILRDTMGLEPGNYTTDERLKEVSYGVLEGVTQPELKQQNRELYYYRKQNAWAFRPENGESQEDVLARIKDWHTSLDKDQKYIISAHGAVGRVMRHYLAGVPTQDVARYAFPQDKIFLFSDGEEQII